MTKSRDTADILEDVKVDGNVTAVGQETLKDNTGAHNTGVGYRAMYNSSLSGSFNVALGNYNLYANTSGASNTALGYQTLFSNTTASYNTAVGWQSLYSNTTGVGHLALGTQALYSNTTSTNNTAIGNDSLYSNTTGNFNVALGTSALRSNTTANQNTAVGYKAGYSNTTNGDATYVGYQAGYSRTGTGNTCVGQYSGRDGTTGADNTLIGRNAGYKITSGSDNTIIGTFDGNQGGLDIRTSSGNIVLSDGDGNPRIRADTNGTIRLGPNYNSMDQTTGGAAFISEANNRRTLYTGTTTTAAQPLAFFVNSNGVVGYIQVSGSSTSYNTSSDYRLKENVDYTWDATTRLKQLKPARFNFISDADTTVDGFLAHEAQAVVPEAVTGTHNEVDDDGNAVMQGIDQSKLVPLLVKTIQELEARITALEA